MNRWFAAGAIALTGVLAGCGGGGGGGTSVGTYTGSGSLNMTLSGVVEDSNNAPLPGYAVSIDNSQPVTTDRTGSYTITIPTIDIVARNSIKVYNTSNLLAHTENRAIDTAICVQTLQPIVVGPPSPPGLP
jgi:hypothetical protein